VYRQETSKNWHDSFILIIAEEKNGHHSFESKCHKLNHLETFHTNHKTKTKQNKTKK